MTIGKRIKERRLAAKRSRKEVAAEMEVGYESVRRWEADLDYPQASKIPRLARFLNTSSGYLLEGDAGLDVDQLERILNMLDRICERSGHINPPNKFKAHFINDHYGGNPEEKPPTP